MNNLLRITLFCVLACSAGCAVVPKNLDTQQKDYSEHFVRAAQPISSISTNESSRSHLDLNHEQLLSRGDVIKLRLFQMKSLNGVYQINGKGKLELPFLNQQIRIAGLSTEQAETALRERLFLNGWFEGRDTLISMSLVDSASIEVTVNGAVFNPGRVTVNAKPALKPQDSLRQQSGDYSNGRDLTSAIMAAGGMRPDASPSHILIVRGQNTYQVNVEEIMQGNRFADTPSLVHGDLIIVKSSGTENEQLIKPSQLTPPGIRVLISNLTAPTLSNALSSVGADSTRLPYGTSLLDAAISANCIGGTHQANASRTLLLITRDYGSSNQIVVKRSINKLLANSSQHQVNPFIMPNDGIACYDSRFTNWRDVASGLVEIFGFGILGRLL